MSASMYEKIEDNNEQEEETKENNMDIDGEDSKRKETNSGDGNTPNEEVVISLSIRVLLMMGTKTIHHVLYDFPQSSVNLYNKLKHGTLISVVLTVDIKEW